MKSNRDVPLGTLIKPAKVIKAGDGSYPILSMTMHNGLMNQNQKFKKSIASNDLSGYKVVKRGQLVVGFPIDEGVLDFQQLYDEAIVSPAYGIWDLTDIEGVDINYLGLALKSDRSLAYYKAKLQGSTARRRSLPKDVFLALPVHLPNINEQKRIVEQHRLKKLIEQKREFQQELFDELKSSIFREMFLDKSFPNKKLFEIAFTSSGATPNRSNKNFYKDGTIPWVKSGELHQELITSVSEKITDEALEKTSVQLLPAGTVLIAMYGATVGAVSQLGIEATTNQAVCAIQIKDPCITETYLKYYLRSQYNFILSQAAGGAQPNINQGIIKNLTIPIPPLNEQIKFSKILKIKQLSVSQ